MNILFSLIKKETLHILRDSRTMFVIFFIPVMLLLLFGFAISTEVNRIKVMIVCNQQDESTREIISRIDANPYFEMPGVISPVDAEHYLRKGEADAIVFLRSRNGHVERQIMVDASNPTIAQSAVTYLNNTISDNSQSSFIINTLYNPQLKSSYNFVPGIMGMIFILICAMMTSVSIVSEKENGSMNLLLVSPIRPGIIIIGKLIPYFLLSCIILTLILFCAYTFLELPLSASIFNVIWVSLLYIILSLSIGLLVSTVVDSQLSALMVTAVLFMLPVIMLSGMIYPIDNMPEIIQGISTIVPARWYVSAMRKLMVQHLEISYVINEIAVMCAMTILILLLAVLKFTKR